MDIEAVGVAVEGHICHNLINWYGGGLQNFNHKKSNRFIQPLFIQGSILL